MKEIKIDLEAFKTASAKFLTAATENTKMQTDIKTESEALLKAWKGKGKDAFDHEYQIIYKNMFTYSEVLTDISKELADIGTGFEEQDLDIQNLLLKNKPMK